MNRAVSFAFGLAFALAFCSGAAAQSGHAHRVPFRISTSAGSFASRPAQGSVTNSMQSGMVVVRGQAVVPVSFTTGNFSTAGVPGLGFDYAHLAAITRNLKDSSSFGATLPSVVQHVTPFFTFPFFASPAQVIIVQQPQPPVVIIQQPPAQAIVPTASDSASQPAAALEPPSSPPRDVGEFVLVRRSGAVVFAVAFSTDGHSLTYITEQGIRRTVALSDLDLEATRRMNEERGTTLRLPT